MKKSIFSLGKVLSKSEQKELNGGRGVNNPCKISGNPDTDWCCHLGCE